MIVCQNGCYTLMVNSKGVQCGKNFLYLCALHEGRQLWTQRRATFYALKSLRNGPSLRSLAASVNARNLLKPVVAAPRPSAAARARTSSWFASAPFKEAMLGVIETAGVATEGTIWTDAVATGGATVGATTGCLMAGAGAGACLLKSSRIACWSAFFKPFDS